MKEEIDGGTFGSKKEESIQETENKFISGDPSMITTDEVFALLGEQVVKAKNWAKIALTWNRNFNTLKQSVNQIEMKCIEINKNNQDLKESNSKYLITNQTLDRRITELNIQIKEANFKIVSGDKIYTELDLKYKESEKLNQLLQIQINNLTKEILNLEEIKETDKKEKIQLKGKTKKKTKVLSDK